MENSKKNIINPNTLSKDTITVSASIFEFILGGFSMPKYMY